MDKKTLLKQMKAQLKDGELHDLVNEALNAVSGEIAKTAFFAEQWGNLILPDTAVGEWLEFAGELFAVERSEATNAVRKIILTDKQGEAFLGAVGASFGLGAVVWQIQEELEPGVYSAVCLQSGNIGNLGEGNLAVLDKEYRDVKGVLENKPLVAAREKEDDESLRQRIFAKAREVCYGGNKGDYRQRVLEVLGVGGVKVFGAGDGAGVGNVVVVICDELQGPASEVLVARVVGHLTQENALTIGQSLVVKSCEEMLVDVDMTIMINDMENAKEIIDKVMLGVAKEIDSCGFEGDKIFKAKVISAALTADDRVLDVMGVFINQLDSNALVPKTIDQFFVARAGEIVVKVVGQ